MDSTDVVVVGGGTGGVTAALAAAEMGARVIVVDRDSGLGGVGTRAGIHVYYWGQRGGLQDALDKQVRAATPSSWGEVRGFHPVAKQVTVESRLAEAAIEVIDEAVVAGAVIEAGRVVAVDVEHPEGRRRIATSVVIDATGNGDVAALCGARFHVGRAWDQVLNTYSYVPRFVDAEDRLTFANFDCGWLDSTDPDDVSRALAHGRAIGRRRVRADEGAILLGLGPQLGIREGRRVVGHATLRQQDVFDGVVRPDIAFRCRTHHDTHARDYANESDLAQLWVPVLGWRKRGFRGDVPYGALVPRDVDGVLIGCRAFSGDQDIAAGVRMQRDMHRLGEAAGVAAGLAVRESVTPREVPIEKLQAQLRDRGVLDELPASTVPDGPQSDREATALLGTPRESEALWWFRDRPDADREPLRLLLADPGAERTARRGAGFALALMGDPLGAQLLESVVRDGDGDLPGDPRTDLAAPRWIAALILLRIARRAGVADIVIDRLPGADSAIALYLLHYLRDLAPQLSAVQRERARTAIEALLARPDLGADFSVQSSERADEAAATQSSIRWNLELTASASLDVLGGDGASLRERWRDSGHGAARRFVRHLESPDEDGEWQRRPADRRVDVVVAGGGLAGVAAALQAAAGGARVLVVEPGPVLGREVTAQRRTSIGATPATEPLLEELRRRGCLDGAHLDAMSTAVALDEICAAAGVEVLLLATPAGAIVGDGSVAGLQVATVAGMLQVHAHAVVDATPSGRVLGEWAQEVAHDELTGIVLVLRHTGVESARRWRVDADTDPVAGGAGTELVLEPLSGRGWARLTVLTERAVVAPEGLLAHALAVLDRLVLEVPELRTATLALPADEPLEPSAGRRRLLRVDAPRGIVGAGAALPDAPGAAAPDREVVEHHLRSGREAGRAALAVPVG